MISAKLVNPSAILLTLLACAISRTARGQQYYPPLDAAVDLSEMPEDLITPADPSGPSFGQVIRVRDIRYQEVSIPDGDDTRDVGAIVVAKVRSEGAEFAIPGLEAAFTLLLGKGDLTATVTFLGEKGLDDATLTAAGVTTGDFPFVARIVASPFPLSLKLNPDFFKPMQAGATPGSYVPSSDSEVVISLDAATAIIVRYTWDGETEVSFDLGTGEEFPAIDVSNPFMLGETGVVLDISRIVLDLSELASPGPSTGPGSVPASWRGVRLEKFAVAFENGIDIPTTEVEMPSGASSTSGTGDFAGVTFENFFIGTGGFSGRMCGNIPGLSIDLFDMTFALDRVCLGFTQNTLSESEIVGTITGFPFFEASGLQLTLALDMQGDFKVGLADPDPTDANEFIVLSIPDILDFYVNSIFFEKREGVFLVGINGEVDPVLLGSVDGVEQTDVPSGSNGRIQVNGLTITSEGDVSLEGGWITLPEKRYLDFKGFRTHLSQIGFGKTDPEPGSSERKNWIGFSGGVELVAGFGAAAEMKRLRFLWPESGALDIDIKLDGVKVAFQQTNVVQFEGAVEWFETPGAGPDDFATEGFAGKLNLNLLALNLSLASRVVVGKADDPGGGDFTFFFVDIESQFPTGIPLGASGVSLYGFMGMFAYSMTPNLTGFDSPLQWFKTHRTADNPVSASPAAPWLVERDAVAFGAGVILGTASDDGFTINCKVALTIAVPGPIVMLSGQANLLKERGTLTGSDEPQFVALAVFDGRADTFIINVGVALDLAKIIKVSGEAEAFFNLDNPADWHVYLGQRDPESKRMTAEMLKLFKASSYYMIEPDSLAFGAKMTWGNRWKFGPLKVVLEAWIGYDADISWRPIHAWGQAELHGTVELSAFGVGVGLTVDATLEVATPTDYLIDGEFKVKLNLPWPLPDPKATVRLHWEEKQSPEPLDELITVITVHTRKGEWTLTPDLDSDSTNNASGPTAALVNSIAMSNLSSPSSSSPEEGSTKAEASIPMVPMDSFIGVRFARGTNDPDDVAFGNGYPSSESATQFDELEDTIYQYDAAAYELVFGPKSSDPILLTETPTELYGTWASIPSTGAQEADNSLNVLGKNAFTYYTNTTYLGYGDDPDSWIDWYADHYATGLCLDQMDPDTKAAIGTRYRFSAKPGTSVYTLDSFIHPVHGDRPHCPVDLDWLTDEDFVLPPYSAFRFTLDANVHGHGADSGTIARHYRNSVLFHTEGPALDLDDYVHLTVPEFPNRPHYRSYDVSLRFNENYMNKLYREAGQFLQIQVLDENENPIADETGVESVVQTIWDEAPDRLLDATEEAWFSILEALTGGGISIDSLPKDDIVHGRVEQERAMRPGERHLVRTWLSDDRLADDTRLTDSDWLERYPVRYIASDRRRVVLHEFTFTASRFEDLTELVQTYADAGGTWFHLDDDLTWDASVDAAISDALVLDRPFLDGAGGDVFNSDEETISVFLRHLLAPTTAEELTREVFDGYVERTPGYVRSDPLDSSDPNGVENLTDAQVANIQEAWRRALTAYDAIDEAMTLRRNLEPLPEQLEVFVLRDGGTPRGLLLELPEAIDLSRVEITAERPGGATDRPLVVPSPDSTRLFVFKIESGAAAALADGVHRLTFTFHRSIGDANPIYSVRDGADTETATLEIELPDGEFVLDGTS